jgi:hypothetical protein
VASVSVCETSEPPARSVIHCPVVQVIFGSRDVRRSNADWRTDRCWDGRSGLDKCVRSKEAAPSVIKLEQFTHAEEPHQR